MLTENRNWSNYDVKGSSDYTAKFDIALGGIGDQLRKACDTGSERSLQFVHVVVILTLSVHRPSFPPPPPTVL